MGAITGSLELNWGVKGEMYSSGFVFFLFSGTYCTVSYMGPLVCVSALRGGILLPSVKAERQEWTQSDSYKVCGRLLCALWSSANTAAFRAVEPAQLTALMLRQVLTV